jgi:predicted ATP-grasp superfamily ATP-dependent carboligase
MLNANKIVVCPGWHKKSLPENSTIQALASPAFVSNAQGQASVRSTTIALESPESDSRYERVLILDGNARSALAATRSLGRRGVPVVVADETKRTLAGASKYCSESFTYPSPTANLRAFLSTVKAECSRRGIRVIFPMTEISMAAVLKHGEEFKNFQLPFAEFPAFDALTDKWNLMRLAHRLNITIPQTHYIADALSLERVYPILKFPVVLKPYRSRIWTNGRCTAATVKYAESGRELEKTVSQYEYFRSSPFLLQEYISGQAHGIFALYNQSKLVASFAHRRLRENPPSGGVSVLCESVEKNPEAWRMARTLLDHMAWHGVAMAEFKVTADGKPYLMEVNGRFWGSLQLAIDAGVDFPWLLYQLATGRAVDPVHGYATGVRSRWLLGDLTRLCKVLAGIELPPGLRIADRMRSILQFLDFFDANTHCQENRWNDIKPFLFNLVQFMRR